MTISQDINSAGFIPTEFDLTRKHLVLAFSMVISLSG